jgi:hypothetical protein
VNRSPEVVQQTKTVLWAKELQAKLQHSIEHHSPSTIKQATIAADSWLSFIFISFHHFKNDL